MNIIKKSKNTEIINLNQLKKIFKYLAITNQQNIIISVIKHLNLDIIYL